MYDKELNKALWGPRAELEHLYDDVQILEDNKEFTEEERLKKAVPALLSWFGSHARVLPWRENPTPYRVWISEIMLQQTRVEAVKPYFERFLQAFPDIAALAAAEEDRLLKMWEGLGYYNRVRNLQKAAQVVLDRFGGEMPADCEELQTLPGIGSYTAGAVSSIAFGRKAPAVDGNVLRVISRVLASRRDITEGATKRQMEELLIGVMPADKPGEFNQALMEVGATVCIPRGEPLCAECPFASLCLGHRHHLTGEIPVKKAAKARRIEERTVFLVHDGRRVLVRKRPATGLLAGLYEYPNALGWFCEEEIEKQAGDLLGDYNLSETSDSEEKLVAGLDISQAGEATHIFSHVEWRMKGYLIRISKGNLPEEFSADADELELEKAIPNAFLAYTRKIMGLLEKDRKKFSNSEKDRKTD